jgi:hypothetical protein
MRLVRQLLRRGASNAINEGPRKTERTPLFVGGKLKQQTEAKQREIEALLREELMETHVSTLCTSVKNKNKNGQGAVILNKASQTALGGKKAATHELSATTFVFEQKVFFR